MQDTAGPAGFCGKLRVIQGEAGHGLGGGYACFPAVCDGPLQGMLRIEAPKVHGVKPLFLPGLHNGAGRNPAGLLRPLRAEEAHEPALPGQAGHLRRCASGLEVDGGVDPKTHRIDYDKVRDIAKECKPKMILAGASAYPRKIDFAKFREIADSVGAYLMVDMAHIAGLVAAGVHMSPVPYADVVSTTTHKTLRGPRGGMILCKNEITKKNIETGEMETINLAKKIDSAVFPGTQGGPLEHIIAAKAICFGEALKPEFKAYGEQVVKNAAVLAEGLKAEGFRLVSGGTDNHLMLVDVRNFNITGKEIERRLDECFITVNKNAIPNDPEKPFVTSGIRVGTPAATTRGLKEEDMKEIARIMGMVARDFEGSKEKAQEAVVALTKKYPIYE